MYLQQKLKNSLFLASIMCQQTGHSVVKLCLRSFILPSFGPTIGFRVSSAVLFVPQETSSGDAQNIPNSQSSSSKSRIFGLSIQHFQVMREARIYLASFTYSCFLFGQNIRLLTLLESDGQRQTHNSLPSWPDTPVLKHQDLHATTSIHLTKSCRYKRVHGLAQPMVVSNKKFDRYCSNSIEILTNISER